MSTWTKTSSTILAAALTLGASTVGATPAAANPSGNSSCTARNVYNGAHGDQPFGETVRAGAQGSKDAGSNLGQAVVSDEARWNRDSCATYIPGG